jgi:Helix-turn-helix domain
MIGAADLNGASGLDLKYAARFLGLSPHTVRALARRQALAHFRIGRRLVFKEADLVAFLQLHRIEARPALTKRQRRCPPRTWREEYEATEALGQLGLPLAPLRRPRPNFDARPDPATS